MRASGRRDAHKHGRDQDVTLQGNGMQSSMGHGRKQDVGMDVVGTGCNRARTKSRGNYGDWRTCNAAWTDVGMDVGGSANEHGPNQDVGKVVVETGCNRAWT